MAWMTRREVRSQPVQSYDERQLQAFLDALDGRMERVNGEYLRRMGAHIREIGTLHPSDVHRLREMRRMNANLKDIERRIASAAGTSADEIEAVFERVAQADVRMAAAMLGAGGAASVSANSALRRILQGQARETAGRMRNLSNTTVVSKYYRDAVDEAVSLAQSGVEDYGSAVRRVLREAGGKGLRVRERDNARVVDYESGYARRLDSAARMNVLDGMRHLNQSIMEELGREFGANGVELDAHMLCAEDYLPYQGLQFSTEEFEEIQDSLPRPFGEWNCRHSWHPIILGISQRTYSDEQLEEMRRFSTEEIEIDGRTKTRYEWSQEMRRTETAIRAQKDTANLAKAAGDGTLQRKCQSNIAELNRHYAALSKAAGLKAEYERTNVAGFRDAKAGTLTAGAKNGIIITDKQIGKKAGKHMPEWNLDPSKEQDRRKFVEITNDIRDHADQVRRVPWKVDKTTGKRTVKIFAYIKGKDVVLVDDSGEYITTMKDGIDNKRVREGDIL